MRYVRITVQDFVNWPAMRTAIITSNPHDSSKTAPVDAQLFGVAVWEKSLSAADFERIAAGEKRIADDAIAIGGGNLVGYWEGASKEGDAVDTGAHVAASLVPLEKSFLLNPDLHFTDCKDAETLTPVAGCSRGSFISMTVPQCSNKDASPCKASTATFVDSRISKCTHFSATVSTADEAARFLD